MTDDALDRELTYTPWHGSCREMYGMDETGEPIVCCRPVGHPESMHAAGFGTSRVRWLREV